MSCCYGGSLEALESQLLDELYSLDSPLVTSPDFVKDPQGLKLQTVSSSMAPLAEGELASTAVLSTADTDFPGSLLECSMVHVVLVTLGAGSITELGPRLLTRLRNETRSVNGIS